ncbi:bone morphogenetic protein 3-like isoform X1 [Cherax quadricarinatus]
MVGWACLVWVVWAAVGVSGARDKQVGVPGVLVETLRQVLRVPSNDGGPGSYFRAPRPPHYMMHLYSKLSKGQTALPREANTVTSVTPHTEEGLEDSEGLLVYQVPGSLDDQVPGSPEEHVLGAWLHILTARPSRIYLYLLNARDTTPATPIMTIDVKPGRKDVEVTRAVKEALAGSRGRAHRGRMGVRVEELRRGRYLKTGGGDEKTPKTTRMKAKVTSSKTLPLLLLYSSDSAILDLSALGLAALNLSRPHPRPRPHHARARNTHRKSSSHHKASSTHYSRYARQISSTNSTELVRERRSLEDPWEDVEMVEGGMGVGNAHTHALLTNELPLPHEHHPFTPLLPQQEEEAAREERRRQRRLQRQQRRRRRGRRRGKKDDLIPLPKNYSKTKWGEDTRLRDDRRRRRRRRRRNRRLPDEWMKVAQNTVSNEADAVGVGVGMVGNSGRACQRHKLVVNFRELGWDNWIIAPASFNAFFCAGICPNPLTKVGYRFNFL